MRFTSRVPRTQRHKCKQRWREERDALFLAGNTVTILSLSQLKTATLRSVVNCWRWQSVIYLQKHFVKFEKNKKTFGFAAPHSQTYRASHARWCEAESRFPTTKAKAGLRCKTSKWGELKKLVGQFVVEEMLRLNTVAFVSTREVWEASVNDVQPLVLLASLINS